MPEEAAAAADPPQGSCRLLDAVADTAAQGSDFLGAWAPLGKASMRSNNEVCGCAFFLGAFIVSFLLSSNAI